MVPRRLIVFAAVLTAATFFVAVSAAPAAAVISAADVERAIEQFEPLLLHAMQQTGVPGVAVGVVYDDRLCWSAGYGVRQVGQPDPVDVHTVFQLASVSKPIGSTLIARLVGEGHLAWDDPVVKHLPDFALSDPWVTAHVTVADLYAHRSGLPDHAGDDLEEIGYGRAEIIHRLRLFQLGAFRSDYAYTNYGLTAAAEAAAAAVGMTWEDASEQLLYKPPGDAFHHVSLPRLHSGAQPSRAPRPLSRRPMGSCFPAAARPGIARRRRSIQCGGFGPLDAAAAQRRLP